MMGDDHILHPPARVNPADSLRRLYAPAVPAFAAALLLSVEFGLQKAGHGGLCPTTGCALVGTFVKYGEITFIALGMIFFWLLTTLLLLEKHLKKKRLRMLVTILLAAGLSFDGGILGFQRFGIQEACILCYSVGVALFLTLLVYGWSRRSLATVVLGVAVWSAGFTSQALFVFPARTPDLSQTVMTTFRPAQPDGKRIFFFLIISDFGEATCIRPMTPTSKGSEASCHDTENSLAVPRGFANLDAFVQFSDLMVQSFG